MSIKKILVPTDFTETALNAAKTAASIARETGARIYFLHVVDIPSYSDNYTMRPDYEDVGEGIHILKHVKENFKKLFNQPFMEKVNGAEVVQFDGVYKTIRKQAKEYQIDLIVMGTHGTSEGLNEFFVGSNTEHVVRLAECPVLTVKIPMDQLKVKNVVFASNFDEESVDAFERVKEILDLFGAKLHLVRINTPNTFEAGSKSEKKMDSLAERYKLSNYTINVFNEYSVEDGVRSFGRKVDADVIVMTTHGRTGIAHLLSDSIAEGVVNHFTTPVLTIREKSLYKESTSRMDRELAKISLPETR